MSELREQVAREWFEFDFTQPGAWDISTLKDKYRNRADQVIPLVRADMQREWIDEPTERGEYWVSPFIEGRYISPRIMQVIDYDRPDRGLEVQHDFPHGTIPVKQFCEEYYPKAKWMFIPEPELPQSGTFKEGE